MIDLLANELAHGWEDLRRHWFDPLLNLVILSALFFGLYFGISAAGGGRRPGDLDGLVAGYLCWSFATASLQSVSATIQSESQMGVLEQLYLIPHRFSAVLLSRAIASMARSVAMIAILAVVAMTGTHRWLHVPWAAALLLLALGSLALMGVGLITGGVALITRRLSAVSSIMTFVLMAIVAAPALPFGPFSLLPFAMAASGVRALAAGTGEVTVGLYGAVAANSFAYLAVGVWAFRWMERRAKRESTLGVH